MSEIAASYLSNIKLRLDPSFPIEKCLIDEGRWEPHVEGLLELLARPGDVCIDVGANMGVHSLSMASKVGNTGRVLCFEPADLTFPRLAHNVSLNPDLAARMELHKGALSDRRGEMWVCPDPANLGNACLRPSSTDQDAANPCELTTLDALNLSRLDLIKLDVEGMESKVLAGGSATLSQCHPHVIFESLLREHTDPVINLLRPLGYYLFFLSFQMRRLFPAGWSGLKPPADAELQLVDCDTLAIHLSKLNQTFALHLWPTYFALVLEGGKLRDSTVGSVRILRLDTAEMWIRVEVGAASAEKVVPARSTEVAFAVAEPELGTTELHFELHYKDILEIRACGVRSDGSRITLNAHLLSGGAFLG